MLNIKEHPILCLLNFMTDTRTRRTVGLLEMKSLSRALVFLLTAVSLFNHTISAHPGSGIVVDSHGNVFVGDINRGLLKFTPDGKVSVVLEKAGHWLAVDADKKFAGMDF